MAAAFALTIFLSAGLLFLVQPMVGKLALPLLGGTPAVWTTCMVFFQSILLAGYLYAHLATKWLGPRRQSRFHALVLALPILTMAVAALAAGTPIAVWAGLLPGNQDFPVPGVLLVLFAAIGLPLFVVSATAPLLQRWFADTDHPAAADPYFLYSASNLGSFLALFAYPWLIEPNFTLKQQAWAWALGYAALIGLIALCGARLRSSGGPRPVAAGAKPPLPPITTPQRFHWLALAAVPSSMMLAVTAYATTDIAPIPLLWVIPLGIYLLTFVAAFARLPRAFTVLFEIVPPVFLLIQVFFITTEHRFSLTSMQIAAHFVAFAAAAMMCHWQLAKHRPAADQLTEFYLWVSLGGVAGGLFNAVAAPLIFNGLAEYTVAVLAACFLVTPLHANTGLRWVNRALDVGIPVVVTAVAFALVDFKEAFTFQSLCERLKSITNDKLVIESNWLQTLFVYGAPLVLTYLSVDRPVRFGLCALGVVAAAGWSARDPDTILQQRSFFGVLKVQVYDEDHAGVPVKLHKLVHGTTMHGEQVVDPPSPNPEPLTYYGRSGPIGNIFANVPATKEPLAFVGLGTGSLTAYGRPGQPVTVYEIDPLVRRIATNPDYFQYAQSAIDRGVKLSIVMGDARLKLADAPDGTYGLIAVDAFSSDSIPVHLLTREAVQMYFRKLKPNGVLALHVSNRYLELERVAGRIATSLNKPARAWYDDADDTDTGKSRSHWIVLANRDEDFGTLPEWWKPLEPDAAAPLWTDDFTNVLSIFNWDQ